MLRWGGAPKHICFGMRAGIEATPALRRASQARFSIASWAGALALRAQECGVLLALARAGQSGYRSIRNKDASAFDLRHEKR